MEYPLMIGGERAGSLSCIQSGLYTVMEANLDGCPERMLRLWVHGGGQSAYLGVMQPWSGGLYLRRRLSRHELESFPPVIEYASDEEGAAAKEREAEDEEESLHNYSVQEEESEKTKNTIGLHNNKEGQSDMRSCPYPAPVPDETQELLWFRRPDGSLSAFDGVSVLLALPTTLAGRAPGAVIRKIGGENYMVFRY